MYRLIIPFVRNHPWLLAFALLFGIVTILNPICVQFRIRSDLLSRWRSGRGKQ
jgi:hypothetical protein